jgi:hypothetical protein
MHAGSFESRHAASCAIRRVNAQAEEAGVRLHFGYRIKKADFDAGQLTFETSEGDKTVMVCFASGCTCFQRHVDYTAKVRG